MNLYRIDRTVGIDSGGRWALCPVNQLGTRVSIVNVDLLDDNGNPVSLHGVPRAWLIPIPMSDARVTDIETAHAAAAAQTDTVKRSSHRLVLTLLAKCGPLTDHDLAAHASRETGRRIGHDSIGKRRLEVQRMGFVEKTGITAETPSGSQAMTWRITSAGKTELANWTPLTRAS